MSTSPGGSVHAPTRGHDDVIIRGSLSASASLPSSHVRCSIRRRRSLRHAAEIRNEHTHTRDFDRHREDGKQSVGRPRCSGQPQGRQNAVADDRGDQCTRRRRAEAKESAQLSTKLLSEGCGNAATVDVHPARHSQENREPEGVAIDRDDDVAESPISPAGHSITAYHARRAFMAMNTAAISNTATTPTLLACFASDTTANWAAMT